MLIKKHTQAVEEVEKDEGLKLRFIKSEFNNFYLLKIVKNIFTKEL